MTLNDLDVAVAAARAGAGVVASAYGSEHQRVAKGDTDFATRADIDAENAIMAVISRHRPDDARTGEESGSSGQARDGRRWLVDPLCGTLNYAAGTPLVAVNVALMRDEDAPIGVVADPMSGELFVGGDGSAVLQRGGGTDPLRPTSRSRLVDVNCDGPLDSPFVGGELVADPALRAFFGPRVISSTLALAWVAAGRRAAYVSDGFLRDSVHFAAGIALCRAAGCQVSDLDGNPLHTGRGIVVSADRETHERIVDVVQPHVAAARS
ncbi:MAG: inositol monophosphatase family protein [Candidatus Nanopelagicales bacterium]